MRSEFTLGRTQLADRVESNSGISGGPREHGPQTLGNLPQDVIEDHIVPAARALGGGALTSLGSTAKLLHAQVMRATAVPLAVAVRKQSALPHVPSLPETLAVQYAAGDVRSSGRNLGELLYGLRRLNELFKLRGYKTTLHPLTHGPSRPESWSLNQIDMALHVVLDGPQTGKLIFPDGLSEAFLNLQAVAMRPLLQWKSEELERAVVRSGLLDLTVEIIEARAMYQGKHLKLNSIGFGSLPPIWLYAQHVESLELFGLSLQTLPEEMRGLHNLRTIRFVSCSNMGAGVFASLPDGLRTLDLKGSNIAHVSPDLLRLKKLEVLDLSSCGVTSMPRSLHALDKLVALNLRGGTINEAMSASLSGLVGLEKLVLAECHGVPLSVHLSALRNLKALDLTSVGLESIPSSLANLPALRELYLGWNRLEHLGDALDHLHGLEILDLSNNNLKAFEVEAGALAHLVVFNLGHNNLQKVPTHLLSCNALKVLRLSANAIDEVPDALWTLKNLETLKLDRNQIKSLGAGVGDCRGLRELDLMGNSISEVPASFKMLDSLEYLRLDSIAEAEIQDAVVALVSLNSLFFSIETTQETFDELVQKFRVQRGREGPAIMRTMATRSR